MLALSCSKEAPVDKHSKGTPIQIVVPNLEVVDPEATGTETKVTWRDEANRIPEWEASDAFQMIAYSVAKQHVTNWGDFTVTGTPNQYNTNIEFTGYKPDGFTTDTGGDYFVGLVKNPSNSSYSLTYESSSTRYVFYANIPAEQDGTGFKYSVIGAQYTYDGNVTFGTTNGNSVFFTRSALCKLSLPSGSNIKKIDITLGYSINSANQYLASSGNKQDLKFIVKDGWSDFCTFSTGGGSNTITIKNGDNILPEYPNNVYWACIRTAGNTTRGYAILTFKFTNNDGKVATKVIKMQKDGSYMNIANGKKLNNFGTVTFGSNDFQ